MKKIVSLLMVCLLCGCSPSAPSVPTPSPTPVPTPEPTAEPAESEAAEVIETQEIEAVLEEELPMSLRVTIQDLEVVFAKDLSYTCEDSLQVSDYIMIYYTGEIDQHPVAIRAEKKK